MDIILNLILYFISLLAGFLLLVLFIDLFLAPLIRIFPFLNNQSTSKEEINELKKFFQEITEKYPEIKGTRLIIRRGFSINKFMLVGASYNLALNKISLFTYGHLNNKAVLAHEITHAITRTNDRRRILKELKIILFGLFFSIGGLVLGMYDYKMLSVISLLCSLSIIVYIANKNDKKIKKVVKRYEEYLCDIGAFFLTNKNIFEYEKSKKFRSDINFMTHPSDHLRREKVKLAKNLYKSYDDVILAIKKIHKFK